MNGKSIWFAEDAELSNLIISSSKLENDFKTHQRTYKKGDFIYLPNETTNRIYFILSGRIKIGTYNNSDREVITGMLQKGAMFGEVSILGEYKRKDFAVASEDSVLIAFSLNMLQRIMKDNATLSMIMMKMMGDRASEMENRLQSLVFKDSKSRIIEYIVNSVLAHGQRVGYEWVLRNFVTHQDLASLTATSRQTVTMTLNELRNEHILDFNRKRLLIRDLEKLKSLIKI